MAGRPTTRRGGRGGGEGLSPFNVLVVDAEMPIRLALETVLRKRGCRHSSARDVEEALALLSRQSFDLVITDLHLGGVNEGLAIVRAAVARRPPPPVLVLTSYGNVEGGVEAVKAGAWDFIEKPFASIEELEATIDTALANQVRRAAPAGESGEDLDPFEGVIGEDPALLGIMEVVRRLSDTDATVLLMGESGTGKEVFARALHRTSLRRGAAFVPVNCGAIPESLLESELFGSRKGAYTGASADRRGRFQAAEGGTIFLDEIGDMPIMLQVKLLRVLQNKEIQPVGAPSPVPVNVRVIAATHTDLEQAVRDGRFREDLYYRLNVVPIRIPPLRERRGDVLLMAGHFVERFNRALGRSIQGFDEAAARVLVSYRWPGNVRELENVMERLVILKGHGRLTAADLPDKLRREVEGASQPVAAGVAVESGGAVEARLGMALALPAEGIDLRVFIEAVEGQLIHAALERAGGNRALAARLLGLNRTTLVERLKRRGEEGP